MSLTDKVQQKGVNVHDGLERCMGNSALYERMLKKIPAEVETRKVIELIDEGNLLDAYNNAHALKGTMGNLAVTPLYAAYSEACRLLKDGDGAAAKAAVEKILEYQEDLVSCIKEN